MKLVSLPDCKLVRPALTIGQDYPVLKVIGNGAVIQTSDPDLQIIILLKQLEPAAKES